MEETRDSSFPRDLLHRFMCGGGGTRFPVKSKDEIMPENVELSLGLSLNGRFGVKTQTVVANGNDHVNNKLYRASSVIDFMNLPADLELSLNSPLSRTCSLPAESEAEWRKRKELQTLRRSEAKRKREEKLKNVRVVKGKIAGEIELCLVGLKQSPPSPPPRPPLPAMQFSSQGSIVSQGSGGSSGVSDFESQPCPGINKDTQVPSKMVSGSNGPTKVNTFTDPCTKNASQLSNTHLRPDMPCVSTKGAGPDGKRIQGFLYRYGKGEDVRIVCVCHGRFWTPGEFVKHGGCGDVDHPLRQIIVGSSPFG